MERTCDNCKLSKHHTGKWYNCYLKAVINKVLNKDTCVNFDEKVETSNDN